MALELALRWKPVEGIGLEHCHVREGHAGIHLESLLIGERNEKRFGLRYQLNLLPDWSFESAFLEYAGGPQCEIYCSSGRWYVDSIARPELDGCIDIDISGTPLTNALPIRRARFMAGVPQRFRMAWLPLDTLEPFVDEQIYTKLDDTHFRYQSGDGTFEQVLTLDEHGFVVDYPTLFERV